MTPSPLCAPLSSPVQATAKPGQTPEETDGRAVSLQPIHATLPHQGGGSAGNPPPASPELTGPALHPSNFNAGISEGQNTGVSHLSITVLL